MEQEDLLPRKREQDRCGASPPGPPSQLARAWVGSAVVALFGRLHHGDSIRMVGSDSVLLPPLQRLETHAIFCVCVLKNQYPDLGAILT